MGMMEQAKERARRCVKRIVFPEGDEPRTVQAAAELYAEKLACPVLLGEPSRIRAVAEKTGADIGPLEVVDPANSPKAAEYARALHEIRKAKGVTAEIVTSRRGNKLSPADIAAFNKQYGGLTVRESPNFHDRFLAIDGKTLYLIGASLKDLGRKCFAFTKLDTAEIAGLKARI